jgi:NADH:ubiquinone oxidoreductase subunit E
MAGFRKIGSISDLENIKKGVLDKQKESSGKKVIHLCAGAGCIASGSMELKKALLAEAKRGC